MDGARVLLVEDDLALRDVVARGLREGGLEVMTAGDGASALKALGPRPQPPFEVVLLDIGLPDSDGRDVCQALRARGMEVPVLFLTARDQLHDVLAGFAAGGPAPSPSRPACTSIRPTTRCPGRTAASR